VSSISGRNTLIYEKDWSVYYKVSSPYLWFCYTTCQDLGSLATRGIHEFGRTCRGI